MQHHGQARGQCILYTTEVLCSAGSILLLRELDRQARLQGGAVYMLNGNHESLNVAGNFRCGSASHAWHTTCVIPAASREILLMGFKEGSAMVACILS